jgi:hypothetical protein
MGIACEPHLIGLERLPVDEALVVVTKENGPFGCRSLTRSVSQLALLVDIISRRFRYCARDAPMRNGGVAQFWNRLLGGAGARQQRGASGYGERRVRRTVRDGRRSTVEGNLQEQRGACA